MASGTEYGRRNRKAEECDITNETRVDEAIIYKLIDGREIILTERRSDCYRR